MQRPAVRWLRPRRLRSRLLASSQSTGVTPATTGVAWRHDEANRVPDLSALRGDVRARAAPRGRGAHARPGRQGRRVQPRLPLSEGHRAQAARGGPRPDPPAAGATRRHVARGRPGTKRSPRSSAGWARSSRQNRDAVGVYLGNPNAHNLGAIIEGRVLLQSLGTTNVFSASTVDQMPKQVSAGLMFGAALTVPVPDLDRTDYLLILGANPFASNGSLMTVPDVPGRLRAIRARGGRLVVVDPRRSKTAEEADEHLFIRPGTDAHFLFAHRAHDRRRRPGAARAMPTVTSTVSTRSSGSPATSRPRSSRPCAASTRRRSGESPATSRRPSGPRCTAVSAPAPRSSARSRRGSSTSSTRSPGTSTVRAARCSRCRRAADRTPVARPGSAAACASAGARAASGACPSSSASSRSSRSPRRSRRPATGRSARSSPSPGTRSSPRPNAGRLDRALASLDFMVSVDIYRNETTRHANVILPVPGVLARSHYDVALYSLAVRNVANYSPPVVELERGRDPRVGDPPAPRGDRRRAGEQRRGRGGARRLRAHEPGAEGGDARAEATSRGVTPASWSSRSRSTAAAVPSACSTSCCAPVRTGTASASNPGGLSLSVLEANPHGVDLGPLQPRLPEVLRTPSGKIELAPPMIVEDVEQRLAPVAQPPGRTASSCSSADAISGRTTRGCTTSRCS